MKDSDNSFDTSQISVAKRNIDPNEITISIEKTCRICFDQNSQDLISPCLCSGTIEFVHEECLRNWIKEKYSNISLSQCEICKYKYKLRATYNISCRKIRTSSELTTVLIKFGLYFLVLAILIVITYLSFLKSLSFSSAQNESIAMICIFGFLILVNVIIIIKVTLSVCIVRTVATISIENVLK